MTKNEALKAAIDGKKIRNKYWIPQDVYIFWDGNGFVFTDGNHFHPEKMQSRINDGWQIAPEYVDFATALKAYRNSATIKSITGEKYSLKREDESLCVNLKEIEGKWLILEDE